MRLADQIPDFGCKIDWTQVRCSSDLTHPHRAGDRSTIQRMALLEASQCIRVKDMLLTAGLDRL